MLVHPIIEKLQDLRFFGMCDALEEQLKMPDAGQLNFEERLGLLVDREATYRDNRRTKTRLRKAKLKQSASVEDVDFRSRRRLDKALFLQLTDCRWLKEHNNVLITGPTGVGKSYLACALGHKACREGYGTLYYRLPRLLHDLGIAKADGRYDKVLKTIARADLLILDDWGLDKYVKEQTLDILELLEDRNGIRSTLITSQLPVDLWHDAIDDPTLADAILDRLVHNAYKLALDGPSMRKTKSSLT